MTSQRLTDEDLINRRARLEEYRLEPIAFGGRVDLCGEWICEDLDRLEHHWGAPEWLLNNVRDYVALLAEAARKGVGPC